MFGVFNRISLRKHLRDFWWLLPVNWSFGAVFGTQFSDYFSTVWEMPEKHVWIPRHSCGRSSAEKWSLFCNEHPSFPCLPFRCPNNQHNSEAKSLCLKSWQTVKPQYDYIKQCPSNHPFIAKSHANDMKDVAILSSKVPQSSGWKPKLTRPSGLEGRPQPES